MTEPDYKALSAWKAKQFALAKLVFEARTPEASREAMRKLRHAGRVVARLEKGIKGKEA